MRNTISGQVFAEMIFCASAALDENRQQLNELNVFPVPDGDTGTNMSLTMSAAAAALHGRTPSAVGDAADTAASALLRGARGNSGVILSLLFRGLAKSLRGKAECSAADWAKAMCDGVDAAYKAVMKPAEGTVLTVSRCASEAAVERSKAGVTDIEELLADALAVARETLAKTVDMNPVLKKAGVVDAGGQGYVVILNAMLLCLQGKFVAKAPVTETKTSAEFSAINDEEITFTYCTEFIVAREKKRNPELLRSFLESLGDSLVLVEDDDIIKVHVHTDAPGRALTEALRYGPLQTVKIENMRNWVYKTAWKIDNGESVQIDSAVAKLYCGRAAFEVCDTALQVMGGIGYTKDCRISRLWRDQRVYRIGAGTDEIMIHIAGRAIQKQFQE